MKSLLIVLYLCNIGLAQTNGNLATYFYIPKNDEGIENLLKRNDPYDIDKKVVEASKYLIPKLIFNNNISAFFVENNYNDKFTFGASALFLDAPSKIIVDSKNNFVKRNNFGNFFKENKYIIKDSLDLNWVLTNETKLIDNYKCYKATLTHSVKSRKGTVVAWYCPEIPYSFGPKGYGGLPGLIVELIDKRGVIGLKTLSLNVPIDEKILEIKGEEEISSEKYQKLVEKLIFDE